VCSQFSCLLSCRTTVARKVFFLILQGFEKIGGLWASPVETSEHRKRAGFSFARNGTPRRCHLHGAGSWSTFIRVPKGILECLSIS